MLKSVYFGKLQSLRDFQSKPKIEIAGSRLVLAVVLLLSAFVNAIGGINTSFVRTGLSCLINTISLAAEP